MKKKIIKPKEIRPIASVFLKNKNKYLFVYDPMFRFWRVPGGRIGKGEKVEECLIREMKEELQVDIKNLRFLGFGQDKSVLYKKREGRILRDRLILYFAGDFSGEIKPDPEEISSFKWVGLDYIKKEKNKEGALSDFFKRSPGIKI